MTKFAVFANGIFWGVWAATNERAAITAAVDAVGTEDNTDGMTAEPLTSLSAELRREFDQ